jgi:hypothetical protein
VRHDPESLPSVRSSGVVCSQHAPSRIEPHRGQVTEHGSEVAGRSEPWDVFQERESRSNHAKHGGGCWPHVPLVVGSASLSGNTEGLARESCRHDISHAPISLGVPITEECSDIAKDGGFVEESVGDARGKHSLTVDVSLDIPDRPPSNQPTAEEPAASARK